MDRRDDFARARPRNRADIEQAVARKRIDGCTRIQHGMDQGCEVVEQILGHPVEPGDEKILREKFRALAGSVSDVPARRAGSGPSFRDPIPP